MKKIIFGTLAAAICLYVLPPEVLAAELIPVGEVIGLELSNGSVSVAEFDDYLGGPAQAAGLQIGDEILDIDGIAINSAEDVRQALERSDGQVALRVLRQDREQTIRICPRITAQGPRLGVGLRQGVTGIGTVTWYDPATGRFGSLGHGVNGPDGKLMDMSGGKAYEASVISVKRGKCGEPGQLRGGVDGKTPIGSLDKNTARGVFGQTNRGWQGKTMETADRARPGEATILSTVSGDSVQEYSVEILKIYPHNKTEGRNLLLRVTDPRLLESTGGIVQGMSGSPIIQGGKLVGAVTHVLVNDPTTGYGIFIENMLTAAS